MTTFKARKVKFDNKDGYMVYQYSNDELIASQFLTDKQFESFCLQSDVNDHMKIE